MSILAKTAIKATAKYGYITVASAVGIESIGVPFPGETALMATALYAGSSGRLNIFLVVAAAAAGAIVGDNIGFWIGRTFGYRLLLRYGRFIRITPPRIKLGQYLFLRHGGKMVFFGRFISILRTLAAFLAGFATENWPSSDGEFWPTSIDRPRVSSARSRSQIWTGKPKWNYSSSFVGSMSLGSAR